MLKEDFPLLREWVYLDNAATTQKPSSVINAIKEYYERWNANVHRGVYPLAERSTELYEEAHKAVADFLGVKQWREVVFVRNATEGLNLAAHILRTFVKKGSNIVVSLSEHHSNLLPWWRLAKDMKAELRVVDVREDGTIPEDKVVKHINDNTAVVSIQGASNVTGYITDISPIREKCEETGSILVVDGAQSVPHIRTKIMFDAIAFSAHKMLGPMGMGALWMREELLEAGEPFLLGGDMIREVHYRDGIEVEWNELPWKYEAGTPNVAGAVGFMEAVKYLEKHIDWLFEHERSLALKLKEELEDMGFHVIGNERRGGVVAFWREDIDPHLLALKLGRRKICVRSGFHCAQPLHERLGVYRGSVRASFYLYNDESDIEKLLDAIKEMV